MPVFGAVARFLRAAGPWVQEQGAHVLRFSAQLGATAFEYFCLLVENACLFFLWLVRVVIIKICGGVCRIVLEFVNLVVGSPVRRVLRWVMRNRPVRMFLDNIPVCVFSDCRQYNKWYWEKVLDQ